MPQFTITKEGDWMPFKGTVPKGTHLYECRVEYSKSNRARCRMCGENIDKDLVRLGYPAAWRSGAYGWVNAWRHLTCSRLPGLTPAQVPERIFGWSAMKDEDKQKIIDEVTKPKTPHEENFDADVIVQRGALERVPPPPSIRVQLLPYQEEGYGWMCRQEYTSYGGGILADEMGMGKTLQTICMLCRNRSPTGNPTLVVCPTSAMMQWKEEIAKFTEPNTLSILIYHALNRKNLTVEQIKEYDVVLTTYPVIENEFRQIVNKQKVKCEYCDKMFLPIKLAVHLKYFCGPNAMRTEKQSKTEKKRKRIATQKAMRTLHIDSHVSDDEAEGSEESSDEDSSQSEAGSVASNTPDTELATQRATAMPSLMNVYRELMAQANRKALRMWQSPEKAAKEESAKKQKKKNEKGAKKEKAKKEPKQEPKDTEAQVQPDTAAASSGAAAATIKQEPTEETQGTGRGRSGRGRGRGGRGTKAEVKVESVEVMSDASDTSSVPPMRLLRSNSLTMNDEELAWKLQAEEEAAIRAERYDRRANRQRDVSPGEEAALAAVATAEAAAKQAAAAPKPTAKGRGKGKATATTPDVPPAAFGGEAAAAKGEPKPAAKKGRGKKAKDEEGQNAEDKAEAAGGAGEAGATTPKPKPKPKRSRKAKEEQTPEPMQEDVAEMKDAKQKKKAAPKGKAAAKKRKARSEEDDSDYVPVKPVKAARGSKRQKAEEGEGAAASASAGKAKAKPAAKAASKKRKRGRHSSDDDLTSLSSDDGTGSTMSPRSGAMSPMGDDDDEENLAAWLGEDGVRVEGSMLHTVKWHRIVLDEAHKIKGRTTSTAKSIFSLRAPHKWCLTGTPLQNRVSDLYSLVRFLRMQPYAYYNCSVKGCTCMSLTRDLKLCPHCGHPPLRHYSYFNKEVVNPIKCYGYVGSGRQAMIKLKNDVMDKILLRRTKKERQADLSLPPLNIEIVRGEMSEAERDFYESIYKQSRASFDTYVDKGTLLHNYAHIFDLLTRLRQAVDHPYLVIHGTASQAKVAYAQRANAALMNKGKDKESQNESDAAVAAAAAESAAAVAAAAEDAPKVSLTGIPSKSASRSDVCGICQDNLRAPERVLSACKHAFHRECMMEYVENAPADLQNFASVPDVAEDPAFQRNNTGKEKKSAKPKAKAAKAKGGAGAATGPGGEAGEGQLGCPVCFMPLSVDFRSTEADGADDGEGEGVGSSSMDGMMALDGLGMDGGEIDPLRLLGLGGEESAPMALSSSDTNLLEGGASASAGAGGAASSAALITGLPKMAAARNSILQKVDVNQFASSTKVEDLVRMITDMLEMDKREEEEDQKLRQQDEEMARRNEAGSATTAAAAACACAGGDEVMMGHEQPAALASSSDVGQDSLDSAPARMEIDGEQADQHEAQSSTIAPANQEEDFYSGEVAPRRSTRGASPEKKEKTRTPRSSDVMMVNGRNPSPPPGPAAASNPPRPMPADLVGHAGGRPPRRPHKAIVFSQFTSMLDIVEWRLHKAGVRCVKLLGSLPMQMRQHVLHAFRTVPSVKVLLLSLKAGGEGLNLQQATHVFLLDPWWNPAVEMQAIQRSHRIGQDRPVRAVRFVTKNTIEERMMQLQEKKQLIFEGTVDRETAALAKLTQDDLRFLFS